MSAVILPFMVTPRRKNAEGAFAAINIMARRMGCAEDVAYRAADSARRAVLYGKKSAARAVSDTKADLRMSARENGGLLA